MRLAVIQQKGGVGKTTLSVNIAGELARRGRRVLVIDADVQGSALDWAAAREDAPLFQVIGLPKNTIHRDIDQLAKGYDDVVIDGAPRESGVARSAIMAADAVLIPVQPSPYDVWAAAETVTTVKDATAFNERLISTFVVNRKIANTTIGKEIRDGLAQYELPTLDAEIAQRVTFADSAAAGQTVQEKDPGSLAAKEVAAVVDEILKLVEKANG